MGSGFGHFVSYSQYKPHTHTQSTVMLHTNRSPYGGDSSIDGGRSEVSTSRVEGPECRRVPGQAGSTCKGPEITSADEGKGESNTGGFCGRTK